MDDTISYKITGQTQTKGYDEGRNLVDMYEVYYEGPMGISGNVRVAVNQATPQLVDQLITRQLTTQLQIANLGG